MPQKCLNGERYPIAKKLQVKYNCPWWVGPKLLNCTPCSSIPQISYFLNHVIPGIVGCGLPSQMAIFIYTSSFWGFLGCLLSSHNNFSLEDRSAWGWLNILFPLVALSYRVPQGEYPALFPCGQRPTLGNINHRRVLWLMYSSGIFKVIFLCPSLHVLQSAAINFSYVLGTSVVRSHLHQAQQDSTSIWTYLKHGYSMGRIFIIFQFEKHFLDKR